MNHYLSFTIDNGLALIRLDASDEKVNVLSAPFLLELEETANKLGSRSDVTAAVVFSAKTPGFIAGADISAIANVDDAEKGRSLARQGQQIFNLWAALPFPVVAAVHGHCLGGGTEFALACSARVVAENASFALPEVRLGILPGFGGTQRLPRLIALEAALDMILTGRTVKADHARRIGLADRVVPPVELVDQAQDLALKLAADPGLLQPERSKARGGLRRLLLEKNPVGRLLLFHMAARNVARQTKGHYPAPPAALALVRETVTMNLEQGLEREALTLGQLIVTDVCKNLVHIFFLSQRAKKGCGLAASPLPVKQAAVLGAGVMGAGIAWLFASKSVPVRLKDIRQEAVDSGMEHIRKLLGKKAGDRPGADKRVAEQMALVTGTIDTEGMGNADLVIEAVVEKMPVKQAVLKETEGLLKENTIFATNTSALSVSELQQVAARPENVGGMHFFNPVDRMPLVEIIRGRQTSETTAATLFDLALKLGKTPVLVADRPGFLVNRLLMAYLNEACLMAEDGIDWQSLDQLATAFGLPMGPFRLIDEVGIDIAVEVGDTISSAFSYLKPSPLLERLHQAGLLGKKGGSGFYLYHGKETSPNPAMAGALELSGGRAATESDLRRLLLLMVNEAGRCLDEKVVGAPEDIDTGMVFGTGFPPFRGGLCRWADQQGRQPLVSELQRLSQDQGERFSPCPNLENNPGFYP
ncbi:3-hydroxyacyl-CoA dehydrogenase NAD-binding domain-containing protein [Trichloromonas sp.]|uniref:3-hydroxyacyl-CoA dehydrogenase NAD-binding domain-containing protein n=1 Tax=Trichloromonas sp. TaxID=3069249 RepID=UPI003D81B4C1